MKKFKHVYGLNGQFVLLEDSSYWMPVNDADWDNTPILDEDFFLNTEPVYSPDAQMPQLELPDNIKVFSEEARALDRKRLEAFALMELAKNLKAAQAEYDLEKLIEKIDFHLKQDDIFQ